MNIQFLESEAKRLIGGATIKIEPYNDGRLNALDVSITPLIDKGLRFIRIPAASGESVIVEYLKKIQQNLLQLQHCGAFGMHVVTEDVDQEVVDKALAKHFEKNKEENLEKFGEPVKSQKLECGKCGYSTKYPGILAIHKKKHKEAPVVSPVNRVAVATNDPLIYDAR